MSIVFELVSFPIINLYSILPIDTQLFLSFHDGNNHSFYIPSPETVGTGVFTYKHRIL